MTAGLTEDPLGNEPTWALLGRGADLEAMLVDDMDRLASGDREAALDAVHHCEELLIAADHALAMSLFDGHTEFEAARFLVGRAMALRSELAELLVHDW